MLSAGLSISLSERGATAELYLQGVPVGEVEVKGWNANWGFGNFKPNAAFSHYAPIFGRWSLLMHAQADDERMDKATAEELSRAERQLDALRAKLRFPKVDQWVDVAELAISNELLEWREY